MLYYHEIKSAKAEEIEARAAKEMARKKHTDLWNDYSRGFATAKEVINAAKSEECQSAEKALNKAVSNRESAELYFRALVYNYSKQQFAQVLEELAQNEKLNGVPTSYKKFQTAAETAYENAGLDGFIPREYYDHARVQVIDQDAEPYEVRGEFYRRKLSAPEWQWASVSRFCETENGAYDGRPVFSCEKAREFAAKIRAEETTAAELKTLAYSLEKTRHEINEELTAKMAEWQDRAKVFNVLGDFCAIKYNREAGEFKSDQL